jgi:DNA-binding NarL/FixJ family response regulator
MSAIRVVVADDHTLVRTGLVKILTEDGSCEVVAEAADGVEAVEKTLATRPDVVLIDVTLPRLSGIEAVRRIKHELPSARILALTVHDEEEYIVHMVRAGVTGYLVKDSAARELLDAVRALHRGQGYFGPQASRVLADRVARPASESPDPYGSLTPREREVFHLIADGKATKEIAGALGISVKTAENHRTRVLDKLGVHNAAELVRYAAKKGLID